MPSSACTSSGGPVSDRHRPFSWHMQRSDRSCLALLSLRPVGFRQETSITLTALLAACARAPCTQISRRRSRITSTRAPWSSLWRKSRTGCTISASPSSCRATPRALPRKRKGSIAHSCSPYSGSAIWSATSLRVAAPTPPPLVGASGSASCAAVSSPRQVCAPSEQIECSGCLWILRDFSPNGRFSAD